MLTSSTAAKSANLIKVAVRKTLFETSFNYAVRIFGKDDSTPAMAPLGAVLPICFGVKRFGFLFQLCCQRHKLGSRMSP